MISETFGSVSLTREYMQPCRATQGSTHHELRCQWQNEEDRLVMDTSRCRFRRDVILHKSFRLLTSVVASIHVFPPSNRYFFGVPRISRANLPSRPTVADRTSTKPDDRRRGVTVMPPTGDDSLDFDFVFTVVERMSDSEVMDLVKARQASHPRSGFLVLCAYPTVLFRRVHSSLYCMA